MRLGHFTFGKEHSFQPRRMTQMHNLLLNYGLHKYMTVREVPPATQAQLDKFHRAEYTQFLCDHKPGNVYDKNQLDLFGFNTTDCPLFDGIFEFCQLVAGGSIAAAVELNSQCSDICIHWGGGLHHCFRTRAAGFCMVNDAVLCIRELLKSHQRVLYVDIDVHHGDGVEAAFANTNRVLTASFHKYGPTKSGLNYFPYTGPIESIGSGEEGKYYAVNVPLRSGMDDESYEQLFIPITNEIITRYKPSAIVMQAGADSLAGDSLGVFNLTTRGHGKMVQHIKEKNLPLILLGGGGYNLENVSRVWTYESAIALGVTISDDIPTHNYWLEYANEDFKLHTKKNPRIENENDEKYLLEIKQKVMENLSRIGTPSVAIQNVKEPANVPGLNKTVELTEDGRE